jgi:predicted dehydrogenase
MVNDKIVLGWGIIGCGLISGDVCESIKLLPSTQHRVGINWFDWIFFQQIVAVGASSIDRAKSFIDTHQLDGTMHFDSYEQVMQTDGVGMCVTYWLPFVIQILCTSDCVIINTRMQLYRHSITANMYYARSHSD